jgi:hypothetical protein
MQQFQQKFFFDEGLLAVCIGNLTSPVFVREPMTVPVDKDVFFGPAMRRTGGSLKTDVLGTKFLWVDADNPGRPLATLPPTMIVSSGHGWHLYWELSEPIYDIELIERLNQILVADVPTADKGSWNCNRYLRIPGTLNTKEKDKPVSVDLRTENSYQYLVDDILILDRLDKQTRHKIRTGDSRGYRSRSERDWAIIVAMLRAGASDALIERIFAISPCGEKYREDNGPRYFQATLAKAKTAKVTVATGRGFEETPEGYLRHTARGAKRVSTFIIHPKMLLDGSAFGAEDALVTDVTAAGYKWEDKTFTRSAFTGVAKIDKETPIAAWQWLGRDDDIRALLPYLLEKLQDIGFPRVAATSTLGLHKIKDEYYFLGTDGVLSADNSWTGFDGPLAWLPSQKEHPQTCLSVECPKADLDFLKEHLPYLNESAKIWPMLGWYAASPFKTWFESRGYRFPVLNVVGTKGSGKTSLIQRIFMPLFGQADPKPYDANTTRFVVLALLGSSNAIPIAFSEFRYDSVEKFIRYILLSYDTGHDPRGRGDQTTVDYPLLAPFTVDGEDLVEDPAARERIVAVYLQLATVDEGSDAYNHFQALRTRVPTTFGGFYIQQVLKMLANGEADRILEKARAMMFEHFPGKLPDRVRANHIVAYAGVLFWCRVVGMEPPPPSCMEQSISSVYNIKAGRVRTMSDALLEDVVNAASQGTQSFRWKYSPDEGVLWFQLSSAHSWWLASRRRQGRSALERDAIASQLGEAKYSVRPKVVADTWMYGVNLRTAQEAGLDIPSVLRNGEITIKLGG